MGDWAGKFLTKIWHIRAHCWRFFFSSRAALYLDCLSKTQAEKEKVFGAMIDEENATPLLLLKGALDTPVSLEHFLEDVPFYGLYDDVKCARPIELEEEKMHEVSVTPPEQAASLTTSVWNSISSVSIF